MTICPWPACPYCGGLYDVDGSHFCPVLNPAIATGSTVAHRPKGCICPSGSEKTCNRRDCGRKEGLTDISINPEDRQRIAEEALAGALADRTVLLDRIKRLEEALKPFADEAKNWDDAAAWDLDVYPYPDEDALTVEHEMPIGIKVGHLRAARTALEPKP